MRPPPLKHKKRKRSAKEEDEDNRKEWNNYLSNILPHEIMLDIFSRLPVKSLVRFRCVRKSWHKLVLDPVLYTMHSNQSTLCNNYPKAKLMLTNHQGQLYSLDYLQDSNHAVKINIPVLKNNRIWGSCNGLLLTMSIPYASPGLYLSNPSTREYKKIPRCYRGYGPIVYGFGYSPTVNDYEIVRISSSETSYNSLVHVYSLRKNTWRKIKDTFCEIFRDEAGILVEDSLHWIMFYRDGDFIEMVVVAYDIGSDQDLRDMQLPEHTEWWKDTSKTDLAEYKGNLSLFHCNSNQDTTFELWVMESYGDEKSWTKIMYIRKPIGVDNFLMCMTNDDMVLMSGKDDNLILYDPVLPAYRFRLEIKVNLKMEKVGQLTPYVESIVRLRLTDKAFS